MLTRLRKEQPEFERLWNLGEVKCRMDTEKTFVHPEAGPVGVGEAVVRPSSALDLQFTILGPRPGSDERLLSLL